MLLNFGGGDDQGVLLFVLRNLVPGCSDRMRFVIITTPNNPRNRALNDWLEQYDNGCVEVHVQPPNMADLMTSCDFAILAGGMTTFEAVASGLPMLILTVAENQISQARAWEKCGVADYLGAWHSVVPALLQAAFSRMIDDRARRIAMAQRCYKLVDGRGAGRIAQPLYDLFVTPE